MSRPAPTRKRPGATRGASAHSSDIAADRHRRTRQDHAREIAEDYVELISDLIRDTGEARAVDIARQLGVTHVTVTKTITRLQAEGLVTSAPYRSIFLTSEGEQMAQRARERHETVLQFLLALGVPRKDAETDAEGVEHHLSRSTLAAMRRFTRRRTAE